MTPDAALHAGGLVSSDASISLEAIDTFSARTYHHAALGERTVVRIVADTLGPAEDLALDFLGLTCTAVDEHVAKGKRQALGFPGWALANDPANGAYALGIVKDMERLARLARSKPGAARDGFEQLGEQLARTVPHFLPTYYEQVGRTYIESEQANQAAAMFSKARDAERVFGLDVDEDRRRDVFVEFALAGALSTKAVDDYADQLARSYPPAEAHATFHELCVQRTLGGVPPSATMGDRLNKMAAAAGLNVTAEAQALLLKILNAPATSRAAAGFWRGYRRTLVDLAKNSPEVRGRLLNLFPAPQPAQTNFLDWWLELLDATKATDALVEPAGVVPAAAAPVGSPAAWLSRLAAQVNLGWRRVQANSLPKLIERMAPRLKADGVPVDLIGEFSWRLDIELIDFALSLDIPVAPPWPRANVTLTGYDRQGSQRDLLHVVDDPVYGPRLLDAIDTELSHNGRHADQLPASPGVQRLLARWLDRCADRLERGGLPQIAALLDRLEAVVSERTLAVNPTARQRLAKADFAAALGRTLRGGLVDEFGWSALEEAHARLQPPPGNPVRIAEAWPNVILGDSSRAFVVGPDAILSEHDLRIPSQSGPVADPEFFSAGGQLLVSWYDRVVHKTRAYWSNRPNDIFELKQPVGWTFREMASFEVPGVGRSRGGRAVHPGDTSLPDPTPLLTDGSTYWRVDEDGSIVEFEPLSGRGGAISMPAQLSVPESARLRVDDSWLMPALPGLESTPLGTANGLLGWTSWSDGQHVGGRGIDGRLIDLPDNRRVLGLVTFPGDAASTRPLTVNASEVALLTTDGQCELFRAPIGGRSPIAMSTPIALPPLFWHCLRPRDPAGSLALRGISDSHVKQLLAAAVTDIGSKQDTFQKTRTLVEHLLAEVTNDRLREGIVGVCGMAGLVEEKRSQWKALQGTTARPVVARTTDVSDNLLRQALSGLFTERGYSSGSSGRSQTLQQINLVGSVAAGGEMPTTLPTATMPWPQLLGRLAAVAYRAASRAVSDDDRAALVAFLEELANTPFLTHLDRLRVVGVEMPATANQLWFQARVLRQEVRTLFMKRGFRTWFFHPLAGDLTGGHHDKLVVELSPDGKFELPKGCRLIVEYPVSTSWDSLDRVRAFIATLAERGPLTWQPAHAQRVTLATGLTTAESALLLLALPGLRAYGTSFLDKDVRQSLGVTQRDANAAREAFARLNGDIIRTVLAEAVPPEPDQLWDLDATLDRLSQAWVRHVGRRVNVPDQLVRQLRTAVRMPLPASEVLAAVAKPEGDPRLNRDGVWDVSPANASQPKISRTDGSAPVFDGEMLASLAVTFTWLYATQPGGDPIREQLASVLQHARERLLQRDLLVGPIYHHHPDFAANTFDALPGDPFHARNGHPIDDSRDTGALVVFRHATPGGQYASLYVRPADALHADPRLLRLVEGVRPTLAAAQFLLGPGAQSMAEQRTPDGTYEANPLVSAVDVVESVSSALSLSTDEAAAYLQLLTLAEPTTKNLATWNGWTSKHLTGILDALVQKSLVVRAMRPRAGRDVFLPGPWLDLQAPNLPIEPWKMPLYDQAPLDGRVLPLRPFPDLFAAAWQRVETGDAPAFERVPAT